MKTVLKASVSTMAGEQRRTQDRLANTVAGRTACIREVFSMFEDRKRFHSLLASGTIFSVPHVPKTVPKLPDMQTINGYGPPETTLTCCYRLPKTWSGGLSVRSSPEPKQVTP
jgi:hypothetical protein